jgi:hypothetical protein
MDLGLALHAGIDAVPQVSAGFIPAFPSFLK